MTDQTKAPQHTRGPWSAVKNMSYWEIIPENRSEDDPYIVGDVCASSPKNRDGGLQEANARLIAASANAFDTAATRLGLNAVEFAERMQDGGIAELVEALSAALGDLLYLTNERREVQRFADTINMASDALNNAWGREQ